jgi:hypothetical protein
MARTIGSSVRIHQIKVADSAEIIRHAGVVHVVGPAISPSETYHGFPLGSWVSLFDTYQVISYSCPAKYKPSWPEASGEGLTKVKLLTALTVEIRNGSITVKMIKAFGGVGQVMNRMAGFGGERSGLEEKLNRGD